MEIHPQTKMLEYRKRKKKILNWSWKLTPNPRCWNLHLENQIWALTSAAAAAAPAVDHLHILQVFTRIVFTFSSSPFCELEQPGTV